ncbi:MAG: hypothetical protein LAT50_15780 [Ectothiorhodospiraceae bacterium]|nr:hypothetical protein [Ectothiorhodospiraceae bacterium]
MQCSSCRTMLDYVGNFSESVPHGERLSVRKERSSLGPAASLTPASPRRLQ